MIFNAILTVNYTVIVDSAVPANASADVAFIAEKVFTILVLLLLLQVLATATAV